VVLLRLHRGAPVTSAGLAMTGRPSQFGTDPARLDAVAEALARAPDVRLGGFHLHAASNVVDTDALAHLFTDGVEAAASAARTLGVRPVHVGLGGGFPFPVGRDEPAPDLRGLARPIAKVLDARFPAWRRGEPAVSFESGRYLVGDAGTLVLRVQDVKRSAGERFVVLDGGTNVWGGMAALGQLPRIPLAFRRLAGSAGPGGGAPAVVTGPLCAPSDVVSRTTAFPAVAPGDLVAVPQVGAYGPTAALAAFLSRPGPVEAVVDGDDLVDATRLDVTATPIVSGQTGG
jgi:diaminopimelate decarboxylase